MHSNGSSLTSQVGDNTYATTVGRLKYPWLNEAYLKARCSDRCTYFVLFTADVFGIADEHGFAIHGFANEMQIYDHCVVHDMQHLTSRALVLSRLDYCNGLLAKAPDYLLAQLSGVMRAVARLESFSYLEKVTLLTPSVASSTGLTSRSVFVSNYAFLRVGAFTGRLLHTCLNTVFRFLSARLPADHTSVLPHLEICSFQRQTL